ncbi:MAG: hypothetical protein KKA42_02335 [candidate division Zixibacteria bacterium]|nr:hypothetical protein [candidate division Zixibacteria bacterium]
MNKQKSLFVLLPLLAVLLLPVASSYGQIVHGQPTAASTGLTMTHWTADIGGLETSLDQMMIPLTAFVPIKDNFEVAMYVANSNNTWSYFGLESKLGGLGDVRAQASHSFMDDRLLLSAGVNLPTGKKELNLTEEIAVLQAMSLNYLSVPMRRLGEGFGFNVLLGGAIPVSEGVNAGAGITVEYIGEYKPYQNYGDYDPGDLLSINGGVDIERGPMVWTVDLIYTAYTRDRLDGIRIFKQSPQLDSRFSGTYRAENMTMKGHLRYAARGDNKQWDSLGVLTDPFRMYGNEFNADFSASWVLAEDWTVTPAVDMRLIGENEAGLGNSTVFGFGGNVGRRLGDTWFVNGGFTYYTGSVDAFITDIDLTGYRLSLGLTGRL